MPRLRILGCLLAVTAFVVACDSGGGNDIEDISGTWRGTVDRQGTEYTVTLNLDQLQGGQASNLVQGNGDVTAGTTTHSFTIQNGAFLPASNEVSLPQQYEAGRPGQIDGRVGDDLRSMTVTIIGGPLNFNGEEFTVTRGG